MDWRLTLRRAGLPDLVVEGNHGTWHRDGVITRIEEHVSDAVGERVAAYLAKHDAALKPAPPAEPMRVGRMRALTEAYARAKSSADVAGAMAVCAESFVLDTPAFGIASRNRAETVGHLGAFFHAFPDYGVRVTATTFGPAVAACWGTARMTLAGPVPAPRGDQPHRRDPVRERLRFRRRPDRPRDLLHRPGAALRRHRRRHRGHARGPGADPRRGLTRTVSRTAPSGA